MEQIQIKTTELVKVVHIKELTFVGVSHNPKIKKKVLLGKDMIPKITHVSQAVLNPGQTIETHGHPTMYEVFFIQSGKALFIIGNEEFEVKEGDFLYIEPGVNHSQKNPFQEPITWLYFGVAVD